MAEQSTFENELPKKSTVEYVRGLDANGNPILINKSDLASVVGGLLKSNMLYPFMYRGIIELSDRNDLSPLDTIIQMGTYGIKPSSGSWFSLIVYTSFGGTGSDIQIITKDNIFQARIRTKNDPYYEWTDWMKLNN